MTEPFIRNHQYNVIKKQTDLLQGALVAVADPRVLEAVKYGAALKVLEAFPHLTGTQKQRLEEMSLLKEAEDIQKYLRSLVPYRVAFPQVTEKQSKKLFPKNKKLKVPDLATIDYRHVTYLGWVDISTNKMFIVYDLKGEVTGIEGRYTIANKKSTCSFCQGYGEVALFTAVTKSRAAHASPDYYKAVGNYICLNSRECNQKITDVTPLERFFQEVM